MRIEDQVVLMGNTDCPQKVLAHSSIFAFPSSFEGWGLALTEAMSVGLPCIGLKKTAAVNELIIHGFNGVLAKDEKDFVVLLKHLMDNPEERNRMGSNGRAFVEQFSPQIVWDKWEDLIRETIQEYWE